MRPGADESVRWTPVKPGPGGSRFPENRWSHKTLKSILDQAKLKEP